MAYRVNRNITKSIKDFITDQLVTDGWTGITVLKGTSRVYNAIPPIITVHCSDTDHSHIEIGDNSTRRETLVFINIYGADSGIGLVEDLKDWITEVIKNGVDYCEYTIASGIVHSKSKTGTINILTIKDSPIDFDVDKSTINVRDRWRWLISLTVETGKIET